MKEKAKIRKAVYIAVMWCILASVLLGCRKSNVESYASAEEAKQAMSQCRTFLVEGDLDEVNQEGNILADGKKTQSGPFTLLPRTEMPEDNDMQSRYGMLNEMCRAFVQKKETEFKAQAEEYLKKESLAEHFLPVR